MQARAGQVRDRGLERVEAIIERQEQSSSGKSMCRRTATTMASASLESTVERGGLGPGRSSWTEGRFFHLAPVFGLRPCRRASALRLS
jgi:hypothetical protein